MPVSEQEFCKACRVSRRLVGNATTAIEVDAAIVAPAGTVGRVDGWVGTVASVETIDGYLGAVGLTVELPCGVRVGSIAKDALAPSDRYTVLPQVALGSFSDIRVSAGLGTSIRANDNQINNAARFQVGQLVVFSGQFYRGATIADDMPFVLVDHAGGEIRYLFTFSSIRDHGAPMSDADRRKAERDREKILNIMKSKGLDHLDKGEGEKGQ